MLIYYLIFFAIAVFAILNDKFTLKTKKQIFGFFGVFLILFAGLRGLNVDNDYRTYFNYFQETSTIGTLFANPKYFFSRIAGNIEPSIIIIMASIRTISSQWFPVVIFFYAMISITLKLIAIKRLTEFLPYSMLIYFSGIFILQDMTQIRIAVATGFLMLSITYIVNREFKSFVILLLLSVFFHYSAIIFAPFYFLNSKSINKVLYIFLIGISIILGIIRFNPFEILENFDLGFLSQRMNIYTAAQIHAKKINIFNVITLFNVVLCLFFIINSEKFKNKYSILLIKIHSFSIVFFYLFSFSPVIAFRTSEVLNIAHIILLPQLLYIIKQRALAEGTVILISLLYLLNQVLINPIMNPYVPIFSN